MALDINENMRIRGPKTQIQAVFSAIEAQISEFRKNSEPKSPSRGDKSDLNTSFKPIESDSGDSDDDLRMLLVETASLIRIRAAAERALTQSSLSFSSPLSSPSSSRSSSISQTSSSAQIALNYQYALEQVVQGLRNLAQTAQPRTLSINTIKRIVKDGKDPLNELRTMVGKTLAPDSPLRPPLAEVLKWYLQLHEAAVELAGE